MQVAPSVREKIRTPDLLIRSQTLYPAELRAQSVCSFKHRTNYIITQLVKNFKYFFYFFYLNILPYLLHQILHRFLHCLPGSINRNLRMLRNLIWA